GWCIAEVLAHQLGSERLQAERIRLALESNGIEVAPADPEEQEAQTRRGRIAPVPQLIHGLLAARREVEKLLDRVEATEGGLERSVTHPRDGRQSVGWMLSERIAAHEREHVEQIEG